MVHHEEARRLAELSQRRSDDRRIEAFNAAEERPWRFGLYCLAVLAVATVALAIVEVIS